MTGRTETRPRLVVGVADLVVESAPGSRLMTFALGSCLGVTAWDPVTRAGGLLHFMLPGTTRQVESRPQRVHMFGTTGIPALLEELEGLGAGRKRLVVCVAGAAEVLLDAEVFAIGARNHAIASKLFSEVGIVLAAEDTGGSTARTLSLDLGDGVVRVKSAGEEKVLWSSSRRS